MRISDWSSDVCSSDLASSNIHLLTTLGARVRLIAPPTLMQSAVERLGVETFTDMRKGLEDCDIVMMLLLQTERMKSEERRGGKRVSVGVDLGGRRIFQTNTTP